LEIGLMQMAEQDWPTRG